MSTFCFPCNVAKTRAFMISLSSKQVTKFRIPYGWMYFLLLCEDCWPHTFSIPRSQVRQAFKDSLFILCILLYSEFNAFS